MQSLHAVTVVAVLWLTQFRCYGDMANLTYCTLDNMTESIDNSTAVRSVLVQLTEAFGNIDKDIQEFLMDTQTKSKMGTKLEKSSDTRNNDSSNAGIDNVTHIWTEQDRIEMKKVMEEVLVQFLQNNTCMESIRLAESTSTVANYNIGFLGVNNDGIPFDNSQVLDRAKKGAIAMKEIVRIVGQGIGGLGKVVPKIGPFLVGVGAVMQLVGLFLPSVDPVKLEFAKLDTKFDLVFENIGQMKNLITKSGLNLQYAPYERTIQKMSTKLQEFLTCTASPAVCNYSRDAFLGANENNDLHSATFYIWNGVMTEDGNFAYNIPRKAMNFSSNDRRVVQDIMRRTFQMVLKGAHVELAYLKLNGDEQKYALQQSDWDDKISQLVQKLISYDNETAENYINQIQTDITEKLKLWKSQDHYYFGQNLFNFLNNKFYWRDWHVLVYNPLSGGSSLVNRGDDHWVKWCHGYRRFRHNNRNLVVASVDKNKPPIDKCYAKKKLGHVSTRNCSKKSCNFLAKHIFEEYFPCDMISGCTFASASVIKRSDGWGNTGITHFAPWQRLAIKDVGDFRLQVFG